MIRGMNPQELYNEQYYDPLATEPAKSNYTAYVDTHIFDQIAQRIVELFKPKSVLDYGCAKGFVVKHLRERGIDARGVDLSEYAISKADPSVKPFVSTDLDLTRFKDDEFDLVVSFDVLEHISEADLPDLIAEFARIARRQYHAITCGPQSPNDRDVTHRTLKPFGWWRDLFDKWADPDTVTLAKSPDY